MSVISKSLLLAPIVISCLFSISCQKEENPRNNFGIDDAKNWISLKSINSLKIIKSGKLGQEIKVYPDFKECYRYSFDGYEYIEAGIKSDIRFGLSVEKDTSAINNSKNPEDETKSVTRIIFRKNRNSGLIEAFFMTLIGNEEYVKNHKVKENNYCKKNDEFSGYVLFHDLEGSFVNGWRYKLGKVNGQLVTNTQFASFCKLKNLPAEQTETICVIETTYHYTDWYLSGVYAYTSFNGVTTQLLYSFTVYSSGSYTGSGYISNSAPSFNVPVVPIINGSNLDKNPRVACIFNKLMRESILQTYLKPFMSDAINLNYSFSANLPEITSGETKSYIATARAEISLNENTIDSHSNAAIACTLIHETIHAYLSFTLFKAGYSASYLNQKDESGLFMLFLTQELGTQFNIADAQHLAMATEYIGTIAEAITAYDPSITNNEATALAYQGLQNTPVFKLLPEFQQNSINSTITDISNNGTKIC